MAELPKYIVIRPHPDLPPGYLPPRLDGCWYDRSEIPEGFGTPGHDPTETVAVPTGRFEVRDWDAAVAEVYEVRP